MRKIICVGISDLHFSPNTPSLRMNEENWLEAMVRPLKQIKNFVENLDYKIPVVLAGDIFDFYNPTPETINKVMQNLPDNCFAIAGQHDLEKHNLTNIYKSGLQTLYLAGVTRIPKEGTSFLVNEEYNLNFYGADWEVMIDDIKLLENNPKYKNFNILACHKYIWVDEKTRFQGDEMPTGQLNTIRKQLQKFNFAFFGDNHIPFEIKIGECEVVNCGTLNVRHTNEIKYKIGFTVAYSDGTVDRIPYDCSLDNYTIVTKTQKIETDINISDNFINSLGELALSNIDFKEQILNEVDKNVKEKKEEIKEIFLDIFEKFNKEKI